MSENKTKEIHIGPKTYKVPESWLVTDFGEVFQKRNKRSDAPNGEVRYVSLEHLESNQTYLDDFDWSGSERSSNVGFEEGDILFGKLRPYLKKASQAPFEGICSSDIIPLSPTEKSHESFLKHLIHAQFVWDRAVSTMEGTNLPRTSWSSLKSMNVPLPPLPEQKKIATVLSKVDEAIQQTEQVIEKTQGLKQGLMQDLLTKGIEHSEFQEVRLGPTKQTMPEDWRVRRIEEVFDIKAGGDVNDELYSETKDEQHPYPIYANSLEDKGVYGYSSDYTYPSGCVTITGRGSIGRAEFRPQKFNAIVRLIVLIPQEKVDGRFIAEFINGKIDFWQESTGVPQLTRPKVAQKKICLPPYPEQKKIGDILSSVDEKIQTEKTYRDKLKELKKGLMQDLLTGKVRTTDLELDDVA